MPAQDLIAVFLTGPSRSEVQLHKRRCPLSCDADLPTASLCNGHVIAVRSTSSGHPKLACKGFIHPLHVVQLTYRSHCNAGVPMLCTAI